MAGDFGLVAVFLGSERIVVARLPEAGLCIGRRPDANELVLSDNRIAPRQAELRWEAGRAAIINLGGEGGLVTNTGEQLAPYLPYPLDDGSVVHIPPYTLLYHTSVNATIAPPAQSAGAVATLLSNAARPDGADANKAAGPQRGAAFLPTWQASSYLYDLPDVYHDSDFLGRMLLIFEALWEPLEQRQDHLALYFDPRTCPDDNLFWLAAWLDLPYASQLLEGRRRDLITEAFSLYELRGTHYAITRIIELCTGITPEVIAHPDEPFMFQVKVKLPAIGDATPAQVEVFIKALQAQIETLIKAYKPAYTKHSLEITV